MISFYGSSIMILWDNITRVRIDAVYEITNDLTIIALYSQNSFNKNKVADSGP